MKQTNELIQVIIDSIDKSFLATDIQEVSPGVYKLFTCNTLWLTKTFIINIDGNDYEVIDLSPNEWVIITGSVVPPLVSFDIYAPYFWYGTVLAINQIMNKEIDYKKKLPMIWLHEITSESFNTDSTLLLDRESDVDLYFMIDANFADWFTPEHNKYAIRPMRNLIDAFITALRNSPNVLDVFGYKILDHAKFGEYIESKGHVKHIFMDKLSGSQLKMTIPFIKDLSCGICN